MHRRTLIVRRFGAMSFGLGYYEDGVWVDHAVPGAIPDDLTDGERASLDAMHAWFGCCTEGAETLEPRLAGAVTSASST